jgi:hypothetical protein
MVKSVQKKQKLSRKDAKAQRFRKGNLQKVKHVIVWAFEDFAYSLRLCVFA